MGKVAGLSDNTFTSYVTIPRHEARHARLRFGFRSYACDAVTIRIEDLINTWQPLKGPIGSL